MTYQPTRQNIVDIARSWLGTPYRHQASVKGEGCDCLGLLRGIYRELYSSDEPEKVPPYTPTWYEREDRDPLLAAGKRHLVEVAGDQVAIGDVVVFRMKDGVSAKHCGIMTTSDTMIHAYSNNQVVETNLGDWWKKKIVGVFQFPGVID